MARPTDPAKLAALKAREKVNAANYRLRQKSARLGIPVPAKAALQRPAQYRPPRVSGIVERAQASAAQQRDRRAEVISNLPDVRNPSVRLRVGEKTERFAPERKTRAGKERQARAIREHAAAEQLQAVGRARRNQIRTELKDGAQSDRLQDAMNSEQRARFQQLSEKIAKGSYQSLGLLFNYAGGQNDYSAALERILASPESRDVDEGLSMLEALAERSERAASMYSPSAIGRINV